MNPQFQRSFVCKTVAASDWSPSHWASLFCSIVFLNAFWMSFLECSFGNVTLLIAAFSDPTSPAWQVVQVKSQFVAWNTRLCLIWPLHFLFVIQFLLWEDLLPYPGGLAPFKISVKFSVPFAHTVPLSEESFFSPFSCQPFSAIIMCPY